ncbi:MAG: T9SS type A sorting domain-containing protein [Ferruginibacter sp.]
MKQIYPLLLLLFCSTAKAQSIERKIINATGTTYNAGGITLKTSVGEPIVGSFSSTVGNTTSTTLSQGFFTGFSRTTVVVPPPPPPPVVTPPPTDPAGPIDSITVRVYPNPVNDMLNIKGDLTNAKQVQFFDIAGHRISTYDITTSSIQVKNLPAGFYIAKILGKSYEVLYVFKIVKL